MSSEPLTPDDVTDSPTYQWLQVLKLVLGVLVSLLTVLKLLGLF